MFGQETPIQRRSAARSGHVPGQVLTAFSAAHDESFIAFRPRQGAPRLQSATANCVGRTKCVHLISRRVSCAFQWTARRISCPDPA